MLTSRAWWLLSLVLLLLTVGVVAEVPLLGVTALALLLWLTWEGLLFTFRIRWVARELAMRREVRDDRGPVTALWAGRTFQVHIELRLRCGPALPYLTFEEAVPFGLDLAAGQPLGEGGVVPGVPLRLDYAVKANHPGRVRFEGVRVQVADLHGLFYHATFLRDEATFRVLPPLVDAEGKTPAAKRHNLLPPPGINRLPRPGSGSELLDLRDYLPGDPPKTIAWKVSARRDRLITKEYESEVPLRCTLFVDTSNSVRLGPPGRNALARLVEVGSAVAQANMATRDLTGLCLFDETAVKHTRPARTRRHLVQLFNQLADAAGLAPASGTANVDSLLPLAYSFAQEVYPNEMAQGVNGMPFWLPLLHPVPGPWARRTTSGGRLWRLLTLPLATLLYLIVGMNLIYEINDSFPAGIPKETMDEIQVTVLRLQGARFDPEELNQLLPAYQDALMGALIVVLCLAYPLWIMLIRDVVPQLFAPTRRRLMRYRKKLSALFARRYDLGPGGVELLMQDDGQLGDYLERFLNDHHIPHTPALFDQRGRFLYASPEKVDVLASALLRAIGKGHDNELFVLLVDLVELEGRLGPLLRAVKVALARHHQVVVVCPWPPDLAPPGEALLPDEPLPGLRPPGRKRKGVRVHAVARPVLSAADLRNLMSRLTARRYNRSFHRLRKVFARLQVPVVCAAAEEPVRLILERLDRLRGLRRRRR
jgi:uncharacterized protein (DUF58 family)